MPILANSKIVKKGGSEPDQFELSIAQALLELQNNSDLKAQLRELYITKAKEIELFGKKVRVVLLVFFSFFRKGRKDAFNQSDEPNI